MRALVLTYYQLIRSVLRAHARLRRCLTRCRHCRIFFFIHPRNAGRVDLGCPFGCRQVRRRQKSNQRSADYYRDEAGREKKRVLNARRARRPVVEPPAGAPAPDPSLPWPRRLLLYVRLVVALIEARPVSLAEVVEMLTRTVRQHRMVRTRPVDQVVSRLHERPP